MYGESQILYNLGGVGGKITPYLKLVRIILESWNLAYKYTPICSLRKYTF